jgi:serine protease DegQ
VKSAIPSKNKRIHICSPKKRPGFPGCFFACWRLLGNNYQLILILILMRKLWLLFAQMATITMAVLFVVTLVRPDWLPGRGEAAPKNEGAPAQQTPANAAVPTSGAYAQLTYRDAARKAIPSVVNIFTTTEAKATQNNPLLDDPILRRFFGDRLDEDSEPQSSLGSGVIVRADGYILTNHHVVEGADEIKVAFSDGHTLNAKIVGTDQETDIAVLKVEAVNLSAVTFAQSEQAKVGDVVLAIGDPFGVGQTVTMGIISALGRSRLGINQFENFIQTDAAINPGNSGGALVDVNGNLLGINSAIYSRSGGSQGIGFSIPVSLAKHVMEQIIQTGSVTRGWIGIEFDNQDLTPEVIDTLKIGSAKGALIRGVLRDGPADKAKLRPGDLLTAVNGKAVKDSTDMLNQISELPPGKPANLTVLRDQKAMTFEVTVGKRPKTQAPKTPSK